MPDAGLLRSLTLARGDLDRAAERRDDTAWLEATWADPEARVVVVRRGRAATRRSADNGAELVLLPPDEVGEDGVRVLLAVEEGVAFLALLVDDDAPEGDADGVRWSGLREVGATLGDRDAGLLVMAVALANWHATHPRCPRCGAASEPSQAGWSRTCPDDGTQHFPRSDPAVIVLVTDDADRALLGRRADWAEGWYSTLAGFVEAGESAEMAVVREMLEEAGVLIDLERLDYLGSQPWPFPSSLMLGYRARVSAASGESRPDGVEISELRWFTRDELLAGAEDGSVRIPPPLSIARRLIEHWYGGQLPGTWSRP
jgi:NAD+ diphosphatase